MFTSATITAAAPLIGHTPEQMRVVHSLAVFATPIVVFIVATLIAHKFLRSYFAASFISVWFALAAFLGGVIVTPHFYTPSEQEVAAWLQGSYGVEASQQTLKELARDSVNYSYGESTTVHDKVTVGGALVMPVSDGKELRLYDQMGKELPAAERK